LKNLLERDDTENNRKNLTELNQLALDAVDHYITVDVIVIGNQVLMELVENGQQEINMTNYNDSYIDVKGSDNNIYLVDVERVGFNTIEFSLIVGKIRIGKEDYTDNISIDIASKIVENFILQSKERFGVSKEELYDILDILTNSTVNNHFDYLKLLREIVPKIEKLLQ
jgi:hypothetical protein